MSSNSFCHFFDRHAGMSAKHIRLNPTVVGFWPLLLLVSFASANFLPAVVVGYRWTVEFSLAAFLLLATIYEFHSYDPRNWCGFSKYGKLLSLYPLAIFTVWSFASISWANSHRNVLHHSLLWACYVVFYILIRNALGNKDRSGFIFVSAGGVVASIGLACLIEYVGDAGPVSPNFVLRYYPYAEIAASFLPIFLALAIELNGRQSTIAFAAFAVVWAMIVATASRTMFIAGVVGISLYLILISVIRGTLDARPKWLIAAGIFFAIILIAQSPLILTTKSLSERFSGHDDVSNLSVASRTFLWGMAVEGFRMSPIVGIGADNYFTNYRQLRESYSAHNPDNPNLEINEDFVAERTHNEYLQILCELGTIGFLIFIAFLGGIIYMFIRAVSIKASPPTVAALSGMLAFLIASLSSSYSFRFPANGLAFFFLLASASVEILASNPEEPGHSSSRFRPLGWFLVLSAIIGTSMLLFSGLRGLSMKYLVNFQNTLDESLATKEIQTAITIDPSEPLFRYYFGQRLYLNGKDDEAVSQIRLAIDNGISTPISYFTLSTAFVRSGQDTKARQTFEEAVQVYPRSIFLRTAYAWFLRRVGMIDQADVQFQKAFSIDEKQARSWQLAHDEGLETLVQISRVNRNFASPFELLPPTAPLSLANFQKTKVKN